MKKILIVSDHFFPAANVGAVRPSKIAKRLTADGYCVDVFTRYPIGKNSAEYCNKCFSFQSGSALNVMKSESARERTGTKKFLYEKFNYIYKKLCIDRFILIPHVLPPHKTTCHVSFKDRVDMIKQNQEHIQLHRLFKQENFSLMKVYLTLLLLM